MTATNHWDSVYSTNSAEAVSWYQPHADQSLRLIQASGLPLGAGIIDVGGGASPLVDDLLAHGYTNLSVLDLSQAALSAVQKRLGAAADMVRWIDGDITHVALPHHAYDLWHDRAVFHFLTDPKQRQAYVESVLSAVKPGGHVIVATFAEDGPSQCSGLPVMRYRADDLHAEFGAPFTLIRHEREEHRTPFGATQNFIYCYCRKENT